MAENELINYENINIKIQNNFQEDQKKFDQVNPIFLEKELVEIKLENFENLANIGEKFKDIRTKNKKNKLKIKNKASNTTSKNFYKNLNKDEIHVCYGSPAIWLKNIKKFPNAETNKKEEKSNWSNSKLISNIKIREDLKQIGMLTERSQIDMNHSHNNFDNRTIKGISLTEKLSNRENVNSNKNQFPIFSNLKNDSPVLIKLKNYKDHHKIIEKEKKIFLYQKNPSFTKTRIQKSDTLDLTNIQRDSVQVKTLIYNSSLKFRNGENKFSNINHHGLKYGMKKSTSIKDITDIEETIVTGSNLDFSSLFINKEIINNKSHSSNKNLLKTSFLLNNKLRKNESISKLDSTENNFIPNNLRASKTLPNSKNSSRLDSDSNSEKRNLCNIGTSTDSNGKSDGKNKSQIDLLQSGQSDEMFKTVSEGMVLDCFLHQTFNGKIIKWKPGEIIETGSSSTVYKALNEEEGSIFVVKRYLNLHDPKMIETFHNEVKIYKQLDHPNIIKFLGSESFDDNLFVYLEYISGGSIKYILDKYGPLNENLIKIFLKQILDGLEYLHSKGIVHRDIKSANILLDVKGNIKLFDFGCSGQFIERNFEINQGNTVNNSEEFLDSLKGTLPWMAPEVVCQKRYGKKADVWSLGCTVLEMVTGKQPWGNLDNFYQAMNRIGRSNDIPQIPINISENLRDFLINCFIRNPKERSNIKKLKEQKFVNE